MGLVKGEGELDPTAHKLEGAGFAVAQTAQVTPEVGFFVTPDLLISGQLRAQYVGGTERQAGLDGGLRRLTCSARPGNGAFAGFAKVTYLLGRRARSASRSAARSAAATSATRSSSRRQDLHGRPRRARHPDLRRHAGRRSVPDRTHVRVLLRARRHGRPHRGGQLALGVPNFTLTSTSTPASASASSRSADRGGACLVNETGMLMCRACPRTATRHRPRGGAQGPLGAADGSPRRRRRRRRARPPGGRQPARAAPRLAPVSG